MHRRCQLITIVLLFLVTASGGAETKPNIILLLADDLGWGDVGFHGSRIKTPNIDGLSKGGVRLDQFYVQPVCSPTRGALMTGRYPMRLGLQCGVVRPWATHGLPLDELTLPQRLRDVGYSTAIVGKWHLGHNKPSYLPTKRGFELQYGHYNGALDYFTHIRDGGLDWHRNDKANFDEGYATDLIGKVAAEIIENHSKERPLFLYVPFNAPHTPLQAPKEWLKKYAHFKQKNRQTFAAMVACMDAAVGQIIDAADKNLDPKNTIVFFCSDNGGIRRLGSNGPLRAGKGTLYEGGVRVPAVISWKTQLKSGSIVKQPMHIVDLYPTLLGLAGATHPAKGKPLDGVDIWPAIHANKSIKPRTLVLNTTPFCGAIRSGDWKLIHNGQVSANATSIKGAEKFELFNLKEDQSEAKELSKAYPEILDRLKKQLRQIADSAVKPNIPPNRAPAGFESPKVWGEQR